MAALFHETCILDKYIIYIISYSCRLFHDPQPLLRAMLDAVSLFVLAIQSSLHQGIIAR